MSGNQEIIKLKLTPVISVIVINRRMDRGLGGI